MCEKKKVLLVDDDADFVLSTKAVLEQEGFEVATARNGEECMRRVKADQPDVILLDMMMETWSEGTDVAERLKKSVVTKGIPIILVSGVNFRNPITDVTEIEEELCVDDYMVKPIEPERLLEHVRKALATPSSTGDFLWYRKLGKESPLAK